MLSRIILFVSASMSIGYAVHLYLYFRIMRAIVALDDDMCSGTDLMICLAAVGLVLAFF